MGDVKIAEPKATDIESHTNEVFISDESTTNAGSINDSQVNTVFICNESQTNAVFINNDVHDSPLKTSALGLETGIPKILNLDYIIADMNQVDSESAIYGAEFSPLTPSPDGKTVNISSSSDKTDSSDNLSDCGTPKGNTFNPFAPASEEFAFAPKKKITREFKIPTRRKLNFDICCSSMEEKAESCTSDEDEDILESMCKSFLELIIKNQCNGDKYDQSDDNSCGFQTPTSIPLLTGIAESCPDAPLRRGSKSRIPTSDQDICRKLEFDSCLI